MPSGNIKQDMDLIRDYYDNIQAKYPVMATPVKLAEEG